MPAGGGGVPDTESVSSGSESDIGAASAALVAGAAGIAGLIMVRRSARRRDKVKTCTKEKFPDEKVYGATGRPELRLLTCGGRFGKKGGCSANVVVFAHLTSIRKKAA